MLLVRRGDQAANIYILFLLTFLYATMKLNENKKIKIIHAEYITNAILISFKV